MKQLQNTSSTQPIVNDIKPKFPLKAFFYEQLHRKKESFRSDFFLSEKFGADATVRPEATRKLIFSLPARSVRGNRVQSP